MTQQLIVTTPANSGLGDSPKSAFDKVNANFTELYGSSGLPPNPSFTSVVVGSPLGGNLGAGTLNATAVYANGAPVLTTVPTDPTFNSIVVGAPTGGDEGAGTVNATGLFVNGAAVPMTQAAVGSLLFPRTAAEFSASVTPTALQYFPQNGVNVLRFGAVNNDTSPTTNNTALANALLTGQPVYLPAGTYQISASLAPLAGALIYGDGIGQTFIHIKSTGGTLNGFGVSANNMTFRDLTFLVDTNGFSGCNAVAITGTTDNLHFERVEFKGVTTKLNNWGLYVGSANLTNLVMHACRFETLDLPVWKANADASAQARCVWSDCLFTGCTDGLELNSPAGSWTDITVTACTFYNNSQFSIGMAGISRASVVGCHFANGAVEQVHIENGSTDIKVIGNDFVNNNTTAGTVGSVSIIGSGVSSLGSHEVIVSGNSFDLTQNSTGSPYGITVQSGGTGNPYNVTICNNTFKTKAGTYPAISASSIVGLNISNNLFTNPSTGSKASYFIDTSDSIVTGAGNTFYNPTAVLHIDDNSFGTLTDSRIDGDLSTFAFLTGNSIGATSVCFDGFSIHRTFTSAVAPTAQTMFPSGTCFDVTAAVRFVFNGSTVSWVTTAKLDWTGAALTVGTPKGAASAGQAFPTAGQWTAAGGSILAAATANSTYAGQVLITVKGPYFP